MNLFACPPRSWRAAPSPFSPILSTIFPPFSVEKYRISISAEIIFQNRIVHGSQLSCDRYIIHTYNVISDCAFTRRKWQRLNNALCDTIVRKES